MKRIIFKSCPVVLSLLFLAGCSHRAGNVGNLSNYKIPSMEAQWIRNGEPIEFVQDLWYPQDGIDVLLDSEVLLIGKHKGVQFFVEKVDVQPYNRLYTKFSKNKFRIFEKILTHDKDKRSF